MLQCQGFDEVPDKGKGVKGAICSGCQNEQNNSHLDLFSAIKEIDSLLVCVICNFSCFLGANAIVVSNLRVIKKKQHHVRCSDRKVRN